MKLRNNSSAGILFGIMLFNLTIGNLIGQDKAAEKPRGDEYYVIETIPTPEGVVLEGGGIEMMKDGRMAVSSRRGDIYMFQQPLQKDATQIKNKLFMDG